MELRILFLVALVAVGGSCGNGRTGAIFECSSDDSCADGFVCDPEGRVCRRAGDATGDAMGAGDAAAPDADASETTLQEVAEDVGASCTIAGGFGCGCAGNDDCLDGLCVEGLDGNLCTRPCVSDCPSDFDCRTMAVGGPDPQSICIPSHTRLCRPCGRDEDCRNALDDLPAICLAAAGVAAGDSPGSFCATSCATHSCPAGYACESVARDQETVKLCVPEDGTCECRPTWAGLGFETACAVTNAAGKCHGIRACGGDGLTACSARTPAAEVCNFEDDDCDGTTDEGSCHIADACVAANEGKPGEPCLRCRPELSTTTWSPAAAGSAIACSDEDPCTRDDRCDGATCIGDGYACADGLACTDDACNGDGTCSHAVKAGACVLDGACFADGQRPDLVTCRMCNASSPTVWSPPRTEVSCDDLSACTVNDKCTGATCGGTERGCDDGRACTVDSCAALGGCAHAVSDGSCFIDGECHADGTVSPDAACLVCDSLANPLAWSPSNAVGCDGTPTAPVVAVSAVGGASGPILCVVVEAAVDDEPLAYTYYWQVGTEAEAVGEASLGAIVADCDRIRCRAVVSDGHVQVSSNTASLVLPFGSDCADTNPCTDDACAAGGGCAHPANTASCADADLCDGSETCANGVCQAGTQVGCGAVTNPCIEKQCNPATGLCDLAKPEHTPCPDADLCDGVESCSDGVCGAGVVVDCSGVTDPCLDTRCNPATGACNLPRANNTTCADADLCNGTEMCNDGVCASGTAVDCSAVANPCVEMQCNPATGACNLPKPNDTPCPDADMCDGAETCTGGVCGGGTAVDCGSVSAPCLQNQCNPATGACDLPKADATPCPDTDLCNGTEICRSAICEPGPALECVAASDCESVRCDPDLGCVAVALEDGLACGVVDDCGRRGLCLDGHCNAPSPQTDGHWTPVQPMMVARGNHTATVLASGRVLVAGGSQGAVATKSAELFVPNTRRWTSAGDMPTRRDSQAAVRLADGRVLQIGGRDDSTFVSAVDVYDPILGWSRAGDLLEGRHSPVGVALGDDEVLIACGATDDGPPTASVEIYTVSTQSTRPTSPLATGRSLCAAFELPDGRVMVAGGQGVAGALGSSEIYDPMSETWSLGPDLAFPQFWAQPLALEQGHVALFAGGSYDHGGQVFDPGQMAWSSYGTVDSLVREARAARVGACGAIVTGGITAGWVYQPGVEVFDLGQRAWSVAPAMAHARGGHTVTALADGSVLVAGGYEGTFPGLANAIAAAEIFRLESPGSCEDGSVTLFANPYTDYEHFGVVATSDGGFVLDGLPGVRVAADGAERWQQPFDGTSRDVAALSGGGFVFVGMDTSGNTHAVAVDADGGDIWAKSWGAGTLYAATGAFGNNEVFAVATQVGAEVRVMRLDAGGETIWDKAIPGALGAGTRVRALPDNGVIVAGIADATHAGWLARLDAHGNVVWQRTYGGPLWDRFDGIEVLPDGGFIVAGQRDNLNGNGGTGDAWLVRTDGFGRVLWETTLDDDADDWGAAPLLLPDGRFLLAGYEWTAQNGFLAWFDADGRVLGKRRYGGGAYFYGAALLADGYVVVAGRGLHDVRKVDAWGNSSCVEAGVCVELDGVDCADGDPCTTDACDPVLGCTHDAVPDGTSCRMDESACGALGSCQSGECHRDWAYRRPVFVSGAGAAGDQTGYVVPVDVDTASLIAAGKLQPDAADLRFTSADGSALAWWLEYGLNTSSTRLWVRVDRIPAAGTTIDLHYGNANAVPDVSTSNNGKSTFDLFDDFEDGVLDSAQWAASEPVLVTNLVPALPSESNGKLRFLVPGPCCGPNFQRAVQSASLVTGSRVVDFKMTMNNVPNPSWKSSLFAIRVAEVGHVWGGDGSNAQPIAVGTSGWWSNTVAHCAAVNGTYSAKATIDAVAGTFELRLGATLCRSLSGLAIVNPYLLHFDAASDGANTVELWDFRVRPFVSPEPTAVVGTELWCGSAPTTHWGTAAELPFPRYASTSHVHAGRLYVIAGSNGYPNFLDDVLFAELDASGSVGPWVETTPLPRSRASHASVLVDGRIYVIGGAYGPSNITGDVHVGLIAADGTIASWEATTALPLGRQSVVAVADGGFIYTFGGNTPTGEGLSEVRMAPILENGQLGAWTTTTPLATPNQLAHAFVANGRVFVSGGAIGAGGYTNEVVYAPILADGKLGAWNATAALPAATSWHASTMLDGYAYAIGGNVGGGAAKCAKRVDVAPVLVGGGVGSWSASTELPSCRAAFGFASNGGTFYVVGGLEADAVVGDVLIWSAHP